MVPPHCLNYVHAARVAIVSAIAFVAATDYCTIEALVPHACHAHAADHRAHEEQSAPQHDEAASACCKTIQAVIAAPIQVDFHTRWIPHVPPVASPWTGLLADSLRLGCGLSPPSREPPPKRPFYRTVFASHAPARLLA